MFINFALRNFKMINFTINTMTKPDPENTVAMEFYNMVQDLVDTINKENEEFRAADSFSDTLNKMQKLRKSILKIDSLGLSAHIKAG